jgi:hypothetical protein
MCTLAGKNSCGLQVLDRQQQWQQRGGGQCLCDVEILWLNIQMLTDIDTPSELSKLLKDLAKVNEYTILSVRFKIEFL